jgi:hypothetical protein
MNDDRADIKSRAEKIKTIVANFNKILAGLSIKRRERMKTLIDKAAEGRLEEIRKKIVSTEQVKDIEREP